MTVTMKIFIFQLVWVCFANGVDFDSSPLLVKQLAANETVHYDLPALSKQSAIIVFWSDYYGKQYTWMVNFNDGKRNQTCPHLPCYFTEDKNLLKLADAVIFHGHYAADPQKPYWENFPSYRHPNQRWVFFSSEAPMHKNFTAFDGIFNWTMTYRRDSSVFMHYGRLVLKPNERKNETNKNFATGKTKLAAMFCSHCNTDGKREKYVEELQKHMDVDVYGPCGKFKCGSRFQLLGPCNDMLNSKYKFYLSFENSICKDYTTEKLSNILAYSNVVPITFGGAEYDSLFPNSSFINALSFPSPKHLADYVKILDKNDTLYNRYFDWKRNQDVSFLIDFDCDLCQKLLDKSLPHATIEKLHDWWIVDSNCTSWKL